MTDQLFTEVLKYMGKTLKREGTTKTNQPYKLWKLTCDIGGQFPWSADAFDNLGFPLKSGQPSKSLKLAELQEGQYYKFLCKATPFTNQLGKSVVGKSVIVITKDVEANKTIGKNHKMSAELATKPTQTAPQPPGTDFLAFRTEYNSNVAATPELADKATWMHMLGCYIANHASTQFKEVIEQCKKNFENKKVQE